MGRRVVRLQVQGLLQHGFRQHKGVHSTLGEKGIAFDEKLSGAWILGSVSNAAIVTSEAHLPGQAALQFVLDIKHFWLGPLHRKLLQHRASGAVENADAHAHPAFHHLVGSLHQPFGVQRLGQLSKGAKRFSRDLTELVHRLGDPQAVYHENIFPRDKARGHGIGKTDTEPSLGFIAHEQFHWQDRHHAATLCEICRGGQPRHSKTAFWRAGSPPRVASASHQQQGHRGCDGPYAPRPADSGNRRRGYPPREHARQRRCHLRGLAFLQGFHHYLKRGETFFGYFFHHPLDHQPEIRWQIRPSGAQMRGLILHNGKKRLHQRWPNERMPARGQLIEHHAQ